MATQMSKKRKYVPDAGSVDNGSGLRYDYGNFYASKTFFDAGKRRRILWGWTNESDSRQDDIDKGWSGIQTIPRAMWLDPSGKQLIQWPIEELERLRGRQISVKNKILKSGSCLIEISGILTSQADVEVAFELTGLAKAEPFDPTWSGPQKLCEKKGTKVKGGLGPFGLLVLASSEEEEEEEYTYLYSSGSSNLPSSMWPSCARIHPDILCTATYISAKAAHMLTQPEAEVAYFQKRLDFAH